MLIVTLIIVAILLLGCVLMSTEHINRLNRASVAIFCGVAVWVLYMVHGGDYLRLMHNAEYQEFLGGAVSTFDTVREFVGNNVIVRYITEACAVILFLIATNTIVEVMNNNGVFDSLVKWLRMRSCRKFLWVISILTFIISTNFDNLTTVVLMLTILRRIVSSHYQRTVYACVIMISATLGGACTVIGDMTSLMLWVRGVVTASEFSAGLLLPSLSSLCVVNMLTTKLLIGKVEVVSALNMYRGDDSVLSRWQKIMILIVGVGGLWAIPTFKMMTNFPPFLGAFCVLACIWIIEGFFNWQRNGSVFLFHKEYLKDSEFISMRIILYYIGVTLSIGVLNECGALSYLGAVLDKYVHNVYVYGVISGILSTFLDNVPCVMAGMNLFEVSADISSDFAINGLYWQLLAYCSAVGGMTLLFGSLAGHSVIQIDKLKYSWFCRHMIWRIAVSWVVGLFVFWLIH